jgi:hypothetical protein
VKVEDKDRPWVGNYPPLNEWLQAIGARCDWQQRQGTNPHAPMIEQWHVRGCLPFIVIVRSHGKGWDIFTPNESNKIIETFDDVEKRIGLKTKEPA